MKIRRNIFSEFLSRPSSGNMLVELVLSIALAVLIIPFIFQYQESAIVRAENVAIVKNMSSVQSVLERYIIENRETLLRTVGKNITRVSIEDLVQYGLPTFVTDNADKYQLRIIKSSDSTGSATLQGVVVYTSPDISPIRTREIVNMGGGSMGFVEGARAYGAFGAWRNDALDMGVGVSDGIVGTTTVKRDSALYLWRIPSENLSDSTMIAPLNLGGHDITGAKFYDTLRLQLSENLTLNTLVSRDIIFENRTAIDAAYTSQTATVAGGLSADGRNMEVSGLFQLADLGKFSTLEVSDLWVTNLTLSGLSISAYDKNENAIPATINIAQTLDMTSGRIEAVYTTVGFSGSITPRLVVHDKIEDSKNPAYYWNATDQTANFVDVSLAELNRLATLAAYVERVGGSKSSEIFGATSANKNATAADYMNAISEIQNRVRGKYRLLNLE